MILEVLADERTGRSGLRISRVACRVLFVLVLAGYLFARDGGFVLAGGCFRFCLRGDSCGGGGFGYKVWGLRRTRLDRRASSDMVAPLRTRN